MGEPGVEQTHPQWEVWELWRAEKANERNKRTSPFYKFSARRTERVVVKKVDQFLGLLCGFHGGRALGRSFRSRRGVGGVGGGGFGLVLVSPGTGLHQNKRHMRNMAETNITSSPF